MKTMPESRKFREGILLVLAFFVFLSTFFTGLVLPGILLHVTGLIKESGSAFKISEIFLIAGLQTFLVIEPSAAAIEVLFPSVQDRNHSAFKFQFKFGIACAIVDCIGLEILLQIRNSNPHPPTGLFVFVLITFLALPWIAFFSTHLLFKFIRAEKQES